MYGHSVVVIIYGCNARLEPQAVGYFRHGHYQAKKKLLSQKNHPQQVYVDQKLRIETFSKCTWVLLGACTLCLYHPLLGIGRRALWAWAPDDVYMRSSTNWCLFAKLVVLELYAISKTLCEITKKCNLKQMCVGIPLSLYSKPVVPTRVPRP